MAFACPRCGDRYTQRLAMVHASGLSSSDWKTHRRSGRHSIGKRTYQTTLSRLTSPPAKRPYAGLLIVSLLMLGLALISFRSDALLTFPKGQILSTPSHTASSVKVYRHGHYSRSVQSGSVSSPLALNAPSLSRSQLGNRPSDRSILAGILFLLGGSTFGALVYRRYRFNHDCWPEQIQEWNDAFMCRACGATFQPHNREAFALDDNARVHLGRFR